MRCDEGVAVYYEIMFVKQGNGCCGVGAGEGGGEGVGEGGEEEGHCCGVQGFGGVESKAGEWRTRK